MAAPITIFTYNRPIHLAQTIDALLKNEYASESDLIIYSDAARNEKDQKGVEETRTFLKQISGFKSIRIIERSVNYGLANNIIDGVTSVVNEYGRIIVLEDDLITSPHFLKFMNEALDKYAEVKEVVSVHGYLYPVKQVVPINFFLKHTDSLGWGTWNDAWEIFNPDGQDLLTQIEGKGLQSPFNFHGTYNFVKMLREQVAGKNNSWAIRWYASTFLADKLSLFSGKSLVFHNGNDSNSTNSNAGDNWLDVELSKEEVPLIDLPIQESEEVRKIYTSFFRTTFSLYGKVKKKVKDIYGRFNKVYQ